MAKKIVWLITLLCVGFTADRLQNGKFQVLGGSELYLNGTSNVNAFTCRCNESLQDGQYKITHIAKTTGSILFDDTHLSIPVRKLNCGHKIMNKDLQDALLAEKHPNISIHLNAISFPIDCNIEDLENSEIATVSATTTIHLAGNSKKVLLSCKVEKISGHSFRLKTTKKIYMTDFGVTPPTAMLGAIKVNNALSINLDLHILLE